MIDEIDWEVGIKAILVWLVLLVFIWKFAMPATTELGRTYMTMFRWIASVVMLPISYFLIDRMSG